MSLLLIFSGSGPNGLPTQGLAGELDTLALVRLRTTEGTDLGSHRTDELLVGTAEDEHGVLSLADLRGLGGNLGGKHDLDVVGITERHGDDLTLGRHPVTDTHELLTDLKTLGDTGDHVVHESPVEAVHGTEAGKVAGTGKLDFISLNGDLDIRIYLLAELTLGAFNLHHVAVEDLYSHSGRKVYRQFTYS
jgi:hypothetical protein